MKHRIGAATAFLCVCAGTLAACGGAQQLELLPVERVVLYQSGIAYMERTGRVSGENLVVPIRPDQINDILTSLVVVDRNGSTASVSLPIDQADNQMALPVPASLRTDAGMQAILDAFRGAEVSIRGDEGTTRGRIVGVETTPDGPVVTLMTAREVLVPIEIEDIDRIQIISETLAIALERSLDESLAEGEWKPIEVTVHFDDPGRHDLTLSYVVEMPTWKPAYRAVVEGDELLLQGWAVVDNVSGEDWEDIRLSLTAGTPISFRYDLHSPVFVQRPDMTGYGRTSVADLAPPTPMNAMPGGGGGYGRAAGAAAPTVASRTAASARDYEFEEDLAYPEEEAAEYWGGDGDYGGNVAQQSIGLGEIASSAAGSASMEQVGSLVRFDLPGRVTIPDQSSSLVTIINETIDGEDALVFQPGQGGRGDTHPYRTLLLRNDTGYPIQPAPITIYRSGTFVGEGITPDIAPGSEAFVAYSLETSVRVASRTSSSSGTFQLVRIVDGRGTVQSQSIYETVYEVTNLLPDDEIIYLRVSKLGGYELDDAPGDVRELDDAYLIPVNVSSGAMTEHTIRQATDTTTSMDILDYRLRPVFGAYINNPEARPDVVEALRPIAEQLDRLAEIETELNQTRQVRGDIQVRSQELRSNIAALGDSERNAELRRTLIDRLAEQDTLLAEVAAEIVGLEEESSALRIQLREFMRNVDIDAR